MCLGTVIQTVHKKVVFPTRGRVDIHARAATHGTLVSYCSRPSADAVQLDVPLHQLQVACAFGYSHTRGPPGGTIFP